MSEKICINCGGRFDEHDPGCPYCGFINESGAEEEYSRKLHKIRDRLDVVDELAVDNFKSFTGQFFKCSLRPMIIVFTIVAVIAGLFYLSKVAEYSSQNQSDKKAYDETIWAHQHYDEWNKYYESGDYTGMVTVIKNDISAGHNVSDWCHHNFYTVYNNYLDAMDAITECAKENISTYKITSAFYSYFSYVNTRSYYLDNLTDAELEVRNACLNELNTFMKEVFSLSDDELNEIEKEVLSDSGYVDYSKCSDYVKKIYGGKK